MGEQLLFLLFILFSVVSALLERRKRKRAQEEETQRQQAAGQPASVKDAPGEETDEAEQAWPFPMGGDPFGLPRPRRSASRRADSDSQMEADDEADEPELLREPVPERKPGMLERLEREARQIEQQAKMVEEQVKESARQIQQVQPRRRVQEAVREQIEREKSARTRTLARKRKRWQVTAASARDAIVYAEILGPPIAERKEERFS